MLQRRAVSTNRWEGAIEASSSRDRTWLRRRPLRGGDTAHTRKVAAAAAAVYRSPVISWGVGGSTGNILLRKNLNAAKLPEQSKGLGGNIGCKGKNLLVMRNAAGGGNERMLLPCQQNLEPSTDTARDSRWTGASHAVERRTWSLQSSDDARRVVETKYLPCLKAAGH